MLKALEVQLRILDMTGPLQRARHRKLRRSVQRIDRQRLLQNRDRLVEFLQLLVADALEIIGIRIPGIELHRLLKALQRRLELIARMLRKPEVVPRLRIARIESNRLLQPLLGFVQLLQSHQRNALIDRRLRQPGVLLERLGKRRRRALSELLAHLRHAAIVQPHRLGVKARLRSGRRGAISTTRTTQAAERRNRAEGPGWQARASQAAEKLVRAAGRDFSSGKKPAESTRALAPEVCFSRYLLEFRPFSVACSAVMLRMDVFPCAAGAIRPASRKTMNGTP